MAHTSVALAINGNVAAYSRLRIRVTGRAVVFASARKCIWRAHLASSGVFTDKSATCVRINSLTLSLVYSISHIPRYTFTHTHTHSLPHSLCLSLCLSLFLSLCLSLSLSHTHTHTNAHAVEGINNSVAGVALAVRRGRRPI